MFNRITLYYRAASPMTGVILYDSDGETVQDVFFLEPAETEFFHCLSKVQWKEKWRKTAA